MAALDDIYKLMLKCNPTYMTLGRQNSKVPFILTNNKIFRGINQSVGGHQLIKKDNFAKAYEEIGMHLGIRIDEYTIYDDFKDYFRNLKTFGIEDMFQLYKKVLLSEYEVNMERSEANRKNQI